MGELRTRRSALAVVAASPKGRYQPPAGFSSLLMVRREGIREVSFDPCAVLIEGTVRRECRRGERRRESGERKVRRRDVDDERGRSRLIGELRVTGAGRDGQTSMRPAIYSML